MDNVKTKKDYLFLKIKGSCMNKPINSNNLLLIKLKDDTVKFKIGDVLVYEKVPRKEFFAHRLVKIFYEGDVRLYMMKGDFSKTCDTVKFNQIIGEAIAVIKNNKIVRLNKDINYLKFFTDKIVRKMKLITFKAKNS